MKTKYATKYWSKVSHSRYIPQISKLAFFFYLLRSVFNSRLLRNWYLGKIVGHQNIWIPIQMRHVALNFEPSLIMAESISHCQSIAKRMVINWTTKAIFALFSDDQDRQLYCLCSLIETCLLLQKPWCRVPRKATALLITCRYGAKIPCTIEK